MKDARRQTIVDLSHPLGPQTAAFPGDPPPAIQILDTATNPTSDQKRHMNCSAIATSLHCGTHMDAPFHFFPDGRRIDQVPLDRCVGPTLLVRLPFETHASIGREHLEPYESQLREARRIVINTRWHHRWGAADYFTQHPVITEAAARFLVECGTLLVGVDIPSVDQDPYAAHLELLGNDVLIVENLTNLDAVVGDVFHLIATPLAISGRDGSPVRAVAVT